MRVEFPEDFVWLFDPYRYKIAWGGRGGMKSYAFADALLIEGSRQPERVVCARELMSAIKESVHELLEQRIKDLGLQSRYEVQQQTILGPRWYECPVCLAFHTRPGTCETEGCKAYLVEAGRTEFIFAGLRHNINSIKSLQGATKVWVEEANNVSKDSWGKLVPTVRWEDKRRGRKSEIWVTFNPELETDETYKRFILKPPRGAKVFKSDYRDNPFLPEVLRIEAEELLATDPKEFEHVYGGECKSAIEGAIYAEEIKAAQAATRITAVAVDRTKPVHTFWDLGFGDKTCIWFAQAVDGWFQIVDYIHDSGKTIEHYCIELQNRKYLYGCDWLPHDAVDAIIHQRLGGGDKSRSIEQLMRAAGRNVRVAPKLHIVDGINAARTIFSQCRFDAEKCADGLQALRHYQWAEPDKNGVEKRMPLHNWASHGADAFRTLAVCIKQPTQAPPAAPAAPEAEYAWNG